MNLKKSLYSFVFLSGFLFSQVQFLDTDILSVDEAFLFSSSVDKDKISLSWEIKPGYYLYKKSILLKSGDQIIEPRFITKNEFVISDEFFGQSVVFKKILKLDANRIDGNLKKSENIQVSYQGCAEDKYCYPKQLKNL